MLIVIAAAVDVLLLLPLMFMVLLLRLLFLSFFWFRVVGEDDFFADLGISYKDFDMPDEVDDFYESKENPEIAKDS